MSSCVVSFLHRIQMPSPGVNAPEPMAVLGNSLLCSTESLQSLPCYLPAHLAGQGGASQPTCPGEAGRKSQTASDNLRPFRRSNSSSREVGRQKPSSLIRSRTTVSKLSLPASLAAHAPSARVVQTHEVEDCGTRRDSHAIWAQKRHAGAEVGLPRGLAGAPRAPGSVKRPGWGCCPRVRIAWGASERVGFLQSPLPSGGGDAGCPGGGGGSSCLLPTLSESVFPRREELLQMRPPACKCLPHSFTGDAEGPRGRRGARSDPRAPALSAGPGRGRGGWAAGPGGPHRAASGTRFWQRHSRPGAEMGTSPGGREGTSTHAHPGLLRCGFAALRLEHTLRRGRPFRALASWTP